MGRFSRAGSWEGKTTKAKKRDSASGTEPPGGVGDSPPVNYVAWGDCSRLGKRGQAEALALQVGLLKTKPPLAALGEGHLGST